MTNKKSVIQIQTKFKPNTNAMRTRETEPPPESPDEVAQFLLSLPDWRKWGDAFPKLVDSIARLFFDTATANGWRIENWKGAARSYLRTCLARRHERLEELCSGYPYPQSADAVVEFFRSLPFTRELTDEDLTGYAESFLAVMESQEWTDQSGEDVYNWRGIARRYLEQCLESRRDRLKKAAEREERRRRYFTP